MKPNPEPAPALGDIPPDVFRKHLHEIADWIADYREKIAERPIAPNVKPGAVLAQLDTASISTMHALAVAREEASTSVRTLGLSGRSELPIFRIYVSDQAHSSVEKGAIALGLGEHNVRRLVCDSQFRMNVATLREAVA